MSEENKVEEVSPFSPIIASRNGISLSFPGSKGSRGDLKGAWYPKPERAKTPEEVKNLFVWLGDDFVNSVVYAKLVQASQTAFYDATHDYKKKIKNEKGEEDFAEKPFDEEEFRTSMESLSTRGESMSDLEDRRDGLLEDFSRIGAEMDIAVEADDTVKLIETSKLLKGIRNELANIKLAMERKERPRKPKAEAAS